jgi:hypothetical protein
MDANENPTIEEIKAEIARIRLRRALRKTLQ